MKKKLRKNLHLIDLFFDNDKLFEDTTTPLSSIHTHAHTCTHMHAP